MSILKNGLVYLAAMCVLSAGALGVAGDSAAAIPEKASSQQEDIGSPSLIIESQRASTPQ